MSYFQAAGMHATEAIMIASLQGTVPCSVLAVDMSLLDTKLCTAKDDNRFVYMKHIPHGIAVGYSSRHVHAAATGMV